MTQTPRMEGDLGLEGKVAIVTGGGAAADGHDRPTAAYHPIARRPVTPRPIDSLVILKVVSARQLRTSRWPISTTRSLCVKV